MTTDISDTFTDSYPVSTSIYDNMFTTTGLSVPDTFLNPNTLTIGQSLTTNVLINSDGIDMVAGTDIVVGGKSLMKTLDSMIERLAMLEPNKTLESEWAGLKELGDRYRAMEQDLLEKAKAWNILKKK
jgi:hypothetical protein